MVCLSPTALGALTLKTPAKLTWFSNLYELIRFGFGVAYVAVITKNSKKND